uniref:NADH-ubiquinone oxidoreductase chain 4 n=1 Tax=Hydra sinensis TaxID=570418 RepID=R4IXA5_9CNID|nr:NADH dehydrogenase subunit 4 [Hydra sinensis]AGE65903.1 NADH dehydrogenase subunit 4 [Hydra sinensis]
MITTIYIIPILAIIHITILEKNSKNIFNISLAWSILLVIHFTINLILNFKNLNFQFNKSLDYINLNYITFNWSNSIVAIDGISLFFIGLSIILIPLSILISSRSIKIFKKEFNILLFIVILILLLFFSTLNLLIFYILFEATLIPIFIIIGIWGYREERIKATFYFFFYTLIGSLLMLLSIIKIYSITGSNNYENLLLINIPFVTQVWLFIGIFFGLAVKIPMVPFHIWLPQAHVEAPIAGSILLAGILLKLGGYGMIRLCYPLFPIAFNFYSPFIVIISIIAIIFGALTTCRQIDIKRLIAYSSISHMGLIVIGIFSNCVEGIIGGLLMMIAHGFSSSGLFIISSILYSRFHSRTIKYFKGLTTCMPLLSICCFVIILANISFPMTFNFIAELFLIVSIVKYSFIIMIFTSLGIFINLIYSLYIYNKMFFGYNSSYIISIRDINNFEFQTLNLIIIFIVILGINPNLIINSIILSSYIQISY